MKKILHLLTFFVVFLSACNDDEEKLNGISIPTSMEVNYEQEIELNVVPNPSTAALPQVTWESENEKIAIVDNAGTVRGKRVGITKITVSTVDGMFTAISNVTVVPTNTLYKEPLLDFSATKSSVKQFETRMMNAETENGLLYNGENSNVRNIMYLFENGRLKYAYALLANTTYAAKQSVLFLQQRYEYLGTSDDIYFFEWKGVNVGVTVDSTLGLVVAYMKSEGNMGGRISILDINEALSELIKSIQ